MTLIQRAMLCLAVTAACADFALAADAERRRETVELDVERGQWEPVAAPEGGTAEGDLQIARALQSAGKHGSAARAIKKWMKTYGAEHELYPRAALLEAENLIARREHYKAHLKLQEFLSTYGGTVYEEEALTQEFLIAEVFLSGTRRKFLGMRILKADDIGLAILDDITVNHSGTTLGELATVTKANHYFKTSDFVMAEFEYNQLLEHYGRSRYTRPATLQSGRAALASFGGIRFDDAALIEADERFRRYLTLYPGSAEQEGIGLILNDINETRAAKELDIGRYYERAGQARAAEFYYRSTRDHWPETIAAIQAAEELDRLGLDIDATSRDLIRTVMEWESTAVDTLRPDQPRENPAARE
jgi:hypothetical protein